MLFVVCIQFRPKQLHTIEKKKKYLMELFRCLLRVDYATERT